MSVTKTPFKLHRHGLADKWLTVEGPDLLIRIDYDDVDQGAALAAARRMVDILNRHWEPAR